MVHVSEKTLNEAEIEIDDDDVGSRSREHVNLNELSEVSSEESVSSGFTALLLCKYLSCKEKMALEHQMASSH